MLNLTFDPFPILNTDRLTLRELAWRDAKIIHQLRADPEFNRYLDRPISTGIADAEAFIKKIINVIDKREGMYWAISLTGTTKLIGNICLWNFDSDNDTVEIGYELSPDEQGKGIMAEALRAVVNYAFGQMNAQAITAFPSVDNERSIALLSKFGFSLADDAYANTHQNTNGMLVYVLKR